MRVHQVLAGAGRVDAVTGQALMYARVLGAAAGGVHAAAIEPGTDGVTSLDALAPDPGDLLLFHWSAWDPRLEPLRELPQRKALVYHNVTPADLLWRESPHLALQCLMGRERLPDWVAAMDVVCAVSEYNAQELRAAGGAEVHVVPILYERKGPRPGTPRHVLTVGRLAPHKRPDLVLRAFGLYRELEPGARLLAVGAGDVPEPAPGVTFAGPVPEAALERAYADASVLLSMSEHEGFSIPLLEAFDHGVPVVARPVGGMPWVGGDAVLWADTDDLAVVAELIRLAASDDDLRAELRRRGEARLAEFSIERTTAKLRAALGL